jgi:integrase
MRARRLARRRRIRPRAVVVQKRTGRPVQFEITEQTRDIVLQWIKRSNRKLSEYLFPSRIGKNKPLTVRHYSRLMDGWVGSIGLECSTLWNTFAAPDKGRFDLPAHRQFASGPVIVGPHQAEEHGALFGDRG